MTPEEADRLLAELEASLVASPDTTEAAKAISDEWGRCRAHLPADVFDALSEDVLMRSYPDPEAEDGVRASFWFDDGATLVGYRDEHAWVARRQGDGSSIVVVYRDGEETERRLVPPAAIAEGDPSAN